ncbi:MAG: biotin--[acetyl-CoA-carboxylase] ligase [Chloroflexi bacterium]|nr:biotin--[acetyl-CoA-carboxylase] ligase [Chloroflexota bacterium]
MTVELGETAVQAALSTQWLGQTYRYFASANSTNDLLKDQIEVGGDVLLPTGTVFLTDYQSRGRGRLNRLWLAPAGSSLLLSALFRPGWPAEQAQWLTMLACLAAAEAIETTTDMPVGVKWPNDLVIQLEGVWHKVSGLLLEGDMGDDGRLQSAILGIGINVNIPPAQLPDAVTPATSLLAVTGRPVSRLDLLVDFLQRLEFGCEAAAKGQSPQPAWNQRLIMVGEQVQVTRMDTGWQIAGTAESADEWGRLLVRDDAGKLHAIAAGDVTLR